MSGFVSLGITVFAGVPVVMLVILPFVCPVVFENVDDQLAAVFNRIMGIIVPIELAALRIGTPVVRLGAGGGAGCGNFRYLYQMVDTQMAGSGIDHIAAVGAGLRGGFRCGSTRVVGGFAILGIAAGAGVPVVVSVAAPLAFPVVTQGSAFGFSASVTGLSFGAGGIDPVVTESSS